MTHFPPAGSRPSPLTDRACPGPLRTRLAAQQARDPGELVAALPGMLGFHPQMSLLLVALRGPMRQIDLVVRSDLPDPVPEHPQSLEHFATHLVSALMRAEPEAAAIVVVTELVDSAPPAAEVVAEVAERMRAAAIPLHSSIWASGTRSGAVWGCYERCRCRGEVPSGAAGAFAAGAALGGVVVHEDREALLDLVEPTDPAGIERRERLVAAAIDRCAATGGAPDPAVGWAAVARALAEAVEGSLVLGDERVAALAVALTAPEVVDAAIVRMAVLARDGAHPERAEHEGAAQERAAAEQLWAALSREAPEPEAAVPASLLAVSALLRGDGALANVALDRAQEAWPGHVLSNRLRAVAAWGPRPEEFRDGLLGSITRRR
jgi:hypothetical protein